MPNYWWDNVHSARHFGLRYNAWSGAEFVEISLQTSQVTCGTMVVCGITMLFTRNVWLRPGDFLDD